MPKEAPKSREELQKTFGEIFGDRFRGMRGGGPLGEFLPLHADDVRRLSEEAARQGVALVALGGETGAAEALGEVVLVRTERMTRFKLRHNGGGLAESEPGTLWISLEDELRQRGRGLAVYPTSALRATVGGWIATDGLGVGSFEHGWLRENVLSAEVVLAGGDLREVAGADLAGILDAEQQRAIVVNARLRTRRADSDVPFAAAFEDREALVGALARLAREPESVPAWHVGFLGPAMAAMRGFSPAHLMFGAYPGHRFEELDEVFNPAIAGHDGERLDSRSAHRVWGERFYPVTPPHPTPSVDRRFTTTDGLLASLEEGVAVQGTLARSGEVLLLGIEAEPTRDTAPRTPRRSKHTNR